MKKVETGRYHSGLVHAEQQCENTFDADTTAKSFTRWSKSFTTQLDKRTGLDVVVGQRKLLKKFLVWVSFFLSLKKMYKFVQLSL